MTTTDVASRGRAAAPRRCRGAALHVLRENLGSAEGNNRLWADVDTDLVFILNPDTVVAPDTLVELVAPLRRPGVGIVDGRQLPIEHPKDYDPVTGDTSWASGACSMVPPR